MKRLLIVFIAIFVVSFVVLGRVGAEIFRQGPPIPNEVVTTDGRTVIAAGDISSGQNVCETSAIRFADASPIPGLGPGRPWLAAVPPDAPRTFRV